MFFPKRDPVPDDEEDRAGPVEKEEEGVGRVEEDEEEEVEEVEGVEEGNGRFVKEENTWRAP